MVVIVSFFDIDVYTYEIRRVAIYGDDDRKNYYEADEVSRSLSSSVGMLVRNRDLIDIGNSRYALKISKLSEKFNLSSNQRFVDEPTVGFCSGFFGIIRYIYYCCSLH